MFDSKKKIKNNIILVFLKIIIKFKFIAVIHKVALRLSHTSKVL